MKCKNEYMKLRKKLLCSYHLCKPKKKAVSKCKYCGEWFCEEHIRATPAGTPKFNQENVEDRLFMIEFNKPGGHPCIPFYNHWKKEKEEELDKAIKKMNELTGRTYKRENHSSYSHSFDVPIVVKTSRKENKVIKFLKSIKPDFLIIGLIIGITILIATIGLAIITYTSFKEIPSCPDGTPYNTCSPYKPYYCYNGKLVNATNICGLPEQYPFNESKQEPELKCDDGTYYNECSKEKPKYCSNGSLVENASFCGCPYEKTQEGNKCVSIYCAGPVEKQFSYRLKGVVGNISIILYNGLKNYLSNLPRTYSCNPTCPSNKEIYLKYLNEEKQREQLNKLVEEIKKLNEDRDEQARIAVSLVQKIPYDQVSFETNSSYIRYPYEVLFDQLGVCGEKSTLLAFLLRELGFGVALLLYEKEKHMAVGILCPEEYSQYKSSEKAYCFIETTEPSIITDNQEKYVGVGKLTSSPEIIEVSNGISFDSVSTEYADAKEYIRLNKLADNSGRILDSWSYHRLAYIMNKYGIPVSK